MAVTQVPTRYEWRCESPRCVGDGSNPGPTRVLSPACLTDEVWPEGWVSIEATGVSVADPTARAKRTTLLCPYCVAKRLPFNFLRAPGETYGVQR